MPQIVDLEINDPGILQGRLHGALQDFIADRFALAAVGMPLHFVGPDRFAGRLGARRTCHLITLKVALRTGLLYSDLKRESRVQDFVAARHRVFFGARVGAVKALTEIGKFFGLDHSTVHNGVKKHERFLKVRG